MHCCTTVSVPKVCFVAVNAACLPGSLYTSLFIFSQAGLLRKQLNEVQTGKQELVIKYEEQLQRVKDELSKLKRSYQKLQSKQLKESREGAKSREEDRTEVTRLNGKIEEFRQRVSPVREPEDAVPSLSVVPGDPEEGSGRAVH
uniref:centrosomal protein of 63 kDa-like n=1 Tax=Oncorhynchus gorbuscha TaxID=8017 RepID=UPI001EAECCAC|nr:centrosomal protein of 63 kDa-like [Oncorhynchus gorbuscha]